MKSSNINLKNGVTQINDDVFPTNSIVSLSDLLKMPTRKGLEKAIISNGEIVNVVSDSYGHLPNEKFFAEVEAKLINADVEYITRSINRDNRSFAVDYILNDERYAVTIKNGLDKIRPMLRFTNSYDGSCKTSGHFGFFREVCSNGLHVAHSTIGFSVKHRGSIAEIVLPEIGNIVHKFMDNEFYTIQRKFEQMAATPIFDINQFVKDTAKATGLFKYEASEKNPEPSLNAKLVIEYMERERLLLNEQRSNLWIGYNAFNELLHGKLKKTFEAQKKEDSKLFDYVLA
jgi:hypothetical protein